MVAMMRGSKPFAAAAIALALAGCQFLPGGSAADRTASPRPVPPTIDRGGTVMPTLADRQCLATLSEAGASYSPLPNRSDGPGCTVINSVSLTGLQGDASRFGLVNLGPVTCETANAFAGWVRYGVDRAARAYLGSPLARVETMGSYACRNVAGSTRRSAHARAEAIDIAAFVLEDGRRVSVLDDWNNGSDAEREFLRVVGRSACKRFGTVLTPDYNADHANHFHLEVGGRSFCR